MSNSTNIKIKQIDLFDKLYDLDVPKDLNENNPEAVGYVKGRTHWGTNTVVKSDWSVKSGSFDVLDNASENRKDPVFVRLFDKQESKEYCFSLVKDTFRTFDVDPTNDKQFTISFSFSAPADYEPGDEVFGTYSLTLAVEPESLNGWPELADRLFDVEVITEAERISPIFLPYTNLTQKNDGQIVISDNLKITDTLSIGKYSAEDAGALFVVGNGTSDVDRKNAFVVKTDGTAYANDKRVLVEGDDLPLGEVITQNSIALGKNSLAGARGCYFVAIDPTQETRYVANNEGDTYETCIDGKIYLSTAQAAKESLYCGTDAELIAKAREFATQFNIFDCGWRGCDANDSGAYILGTGDIISIVNGPHYDFCAEIVEISESDCAIYYRKLTTTAFDGEIAPVGGEGADKETTGSDKFSVRVPAKPHVGPCELMYNAVAIGENTKAAGENAFAEGYNTEAGGSYSHAEGVNTKAAYMAHAEGFKTQALKEQSHAEGYATKTSAVAAHAEGSGTTAEGLASHAEGQGTTTKGFASHAEGNQTESIGSMSHTEGDKAKSKGAAAHAEGSNTEANADYSHAEGELTKANGTASHVEGNNTTANGSYSHAEGLGTSTAEGATAAHAEGQNTQANAPKAHAEGYKAKAEAEASHAEGHNTTAEAEAAHSEGYDTVANKMAAHAEGRKTTASGQYAHAEGAWGTASGNMSHSEGNTTQAIGESSHAEGQGGSATGLAAHKEGINSLANGEASHAEGLWTRAGSANQHVEGRFNIEDSQNKYAHIIGNGTSDTARSNAFTVDWSGNVEVAGDIAANEIRDRNGYSLGMLGHNILSTDVKLTADGDSNPISVDKLQYLNKIVRIGDIIKSGSSETRITALKENRDLYRGDLVQNMAVKATAKTYGQIFHLKAGEAVTAFTLGISVPNGSVPNSPRDVKFYKWNGSFENKEYLGVYTKVLATNMQESSGTLVPMLRASGDMDVYWEMETCEGEATYGTHPVVPLGATEANPEVINVIDGVVGAACTGWSNAKTIRARLDVVTPDPVEVTSLRGVYYDTNAIVSSITKLPATGSENRPVYVSDTGTITPVNNIRFENQFGWFANIQGPTAEDYPDIRLEMPTIGYAHVSPWDISMEYGGASAQLHYGRLTLKDSTGNNGVAINDYTLLGDRQLTMSHAGYSVDIICDSDNDALIKLCGGVGSKTTVAPGSINLYNGSTVKTIELNGYEATIKIGDTTLNETQLKKILDFIETIEG